MLKMKGEEHSQELCYNPFINESRKRKGAQVNLLKVTITRQRRKKSENAFFQLLKQKADLFFLLVSLILLALVSLKVGVYLTGPCPCYADGCGPDYALLFAGAEIYATPNTATYASSAISFKLFSIKYQWWSTHEKKNSPESALMPWKHPGECWAFQGSEGRVVIKLSGAIFPSAVTIEHIPDSMSTRGNLHSAPKNFNVYAVDPYMEPEYRVILGSFQFLNHSTSVQTFQLLIHDVYPVMFVEVEFLSNHGHPNYTCVYKIRVHSHLSHN